MRTQSLRSLPHRLFEKVFELDVPLTEGEKKVFGLFEWFVVLTMTGFAWDWSLKATGSDGAAFAAWAAEHQFMGLSGQALVSINAALITALLAMGRFRNDTRVAYLAAIPLLHLQLLARYAPGPGLHHSYLPGMMLLALATAFLLFRSPQQRMRFGLGMSYVFVAIAYTLAAASKVRQSGLAWLDGDNLLMWLTRNQVHRISKEQSYEFNVLQEYVMDNPVLGTVVLSPGLVVESLAFLFLFKRIRPYYAALLLMMHVGIAGLMKIYFPFNMAILLILGFPWARFFDKRGGTG